MPTSRRKSQLSFKPEMLGVKQVLDIYTGSNHSFLKCRKGKRIILKSWGFNNFSQLGHSGTEDSWCPIEVEFFKELPEVLNVEAGDFHSIVHLVNGDIYAWGKNTEYQLSITDVDQPGYQSVPVKLEFFERNRVENIVSSANFCYAVNYSEQKVYSWGFGTSYVLGNKKEDENISTPFHVDREFYLNKRIEQLSLGVQHVMVGLVDERVENQADAGLNSSRVNRGFEYDLTGYEDSIVKAKPRREYIRKNDGKSKPKKTKKTKKKN